MKLNPKDIKISVYPPPKTGGMTIGMSKGITVTHLPTGKFISCDSERSQYHNKKKALDALEYILEYMEEV